MLRTAKLKFYLINYICDALFFSLFLIYMNFIISHDSLKYILSPKNRRRVLTNDFVIRIRKNDFIASAALNNRQANPKQGAFFINRLAKNKNKLGFFKTEIDLVTIKHSIQR